MQDDPVEVVAIDGPSGAGKSTVARALARRLGFAYLDTGAMYRAVTWHLWQEGFEDLADEEGLRRLLAGVRLEVDATGGVRLNGQDISAHLRSREIEARVSAVSAQPLVREKMRELQRCLARPGSVVAEGRDMTSVVFPGARWKIYLDAQEPERARRRLRDFEEQGRQVSAAEVADEIAARDHLDRSRADAPLIRTADAVYVDSTGKSVAEVVLELARLIRGEAGEKA